MKKLVIALVALFPIAGFAQAQTPKDLLAALLVKWNKPTEPFRIIDNVYYVGTDGLASYLITSPQGHILVDTVMPDATSQTKASIEKLGFKVSDISAASATAIFFTGILYFFLLRRRGVDRTLTLALA